MTQRQLAEIIITLLYDVCNDSGYRRAMRRSRKSLNDADDDDGAGRRTWWNADEMERQLRQYQARRIAEEMARLRAIHGHQEDGKKPRRGRLQRRRCTRCRRRRLGRRTANVVQPASTSASQSSSL